MFQGVAPPRRVSHDTHNTPGSRCKGHLSIQNTPLLTHTHTLRNSKFYTSSTNICALDYVALLTIIVKLNCTEHREFLKYIFLYNSFKIPGIYCCGNYKVDSII